jgi:hypothetical protein
VRKFNGTTFGPPVTIGPGGGIRAQDLFQDAGGRLHAVYERADASLIAVVHAVFGDGVVWRKGFIGLSALGPDEPGAAPTSPLPPPVPAPAPLAARLKPTFDGEGFAKRRGRKFRFKVSGEIVLPAAVSEAAGCNGTVKVTLLRATKVLIRKTATVAANCAFGVKGTLKRSRVRKAKRLRVRFAFSGNASSGRLHIRSGPVSRPVEDAPPLRRLKMHPPCS